jgi:hypothetical protein
MAIPPMVGVDIVCEDRLFGISRTSNLLFLINIRLIDADIKKRSSANAICLEKLT